MKINWFSPIPPVKTPVAEYTTQVLSHLTKKAQVTVWTPQEQWDKKLEKQAEIRPFTPATVAWNVLRQADINFYNLGNNAALYNTIWYLSRRQPGVVILQETNFQHFFLQLYITAWQTIDIYGHKMAYYYGRQAEIDVKRFVENEITADYLAQYYPLTELVIENALGTIVFNKKMEDELKQKDNVVEYIQYPKNVSHNKNDNKLNKYTDSIINFALKQSVTNNN